MLTRTPDRTLADQLAERFAERIRARLLPAGARLPSVRECARQQGVSPHTVVAAYDKLQAQGVVLARRQRGFFVRDVGQKTVPALTDKGPAAMVSGVPETPPATLQESLGVRAAGSRINAMALIRGMFHQLSDRPQPGAGTLPRAWLEEARFLPAAGRKVAAGGALRQASLSYGEPMGDARLRAALAQRLGDLQIAATPRQIITTLGATQALDIVSRALLKAGDPVLVEEPGWSVELGLQENIAYRDVVLTTGDMPWSK